MHGRPDQKQPISDRALCVTERPMHYYKRLSPNNKLCIQCGKEESHEEHYKPRPIAVERSEQWSKEVKGKRWPGQ